MTPSDTTATGIAPSSTTHPVKARVTPALVLVALFWIFFFAVGFTDLHSFHQFMARFAAVGVLLLAFAIWYLVSRQGRISERLSVMATAILGGIIALMFLRHPSVVVPAVLYYAVPGVITAWTIWLLLARNASPQARRAGLFGIPLVLWASTALVRMEGLSGAGEIEFFWRWKPSAEQQFLAERVRFERQRKTTDQPVEPILVSERDWPRFRGPNVDSVRNGVRIATNWNEQPPTPLWRQRIFWLVFDYGRSESPLHARATWRHGSGRLLGYRNWQRTLVTRG